MCAIAIAGLLIAIQLIFKLTLKASAYYGSFGFESNFFVMNFNKNILISTQIQIKRESCLSLCGHESEIV